MTDRRLPRCPDCGAIMKKYKVTHLSVIGERGVYEIECDWAWLCACETMKSTTASNSAGNSVMRSGWSSFDSSRSGCGGVTPQARCTASGNLAGCAVDKTIIGTARLLPSENGVAIRFAPERLIWDQTIPDKGKILFRNFIWRANKHLDELSHAPSQVNAVSGGQVKDGTEEEDLIALSDPNELQKSAEIALRRKKVEKLYRGGLDINIIAKSVGYSESTIKRDLRALGTTEK